MPNRPAGTHSEKETGTMDLQTIREMVDQYREMLIEEHAAKSKAERLRIDILAGATIDGKNAETRKRQAETALSECEQYQGALGVAASFDIDRRVFDAEIGLTKAWLYSQSGH
jgi:hypothetical protein